MRLRKAQPEVGCRINITPLVDVVFLLIIFFMTVSQMYRPPAEQLDLPEAESGKTTEEMPAGVVVVNVHPDGRVVVANRLETAASLDRLLAETVRRGDPETASVLIRADRHTPWNHVGAIMHACARHGIARVKVAVVETASAAPSPSQAESG
jgi:biopolymer transport protein ExbD